MKKFLAIAVLLSALSPAFAQTEDPEQRAACAIRSEAVEWVKKQVDGYVEDGVIESEGREVFEADALKNLERTFVFVEAATDCPEGMEVSHPPQE